MTKLPYPKEKTLGCKLLLRRLALGLNQTEYAKRFGVKRSTLAKWERGENLESLIAAIDHPLAPLVFEDMQTAVTSGAFEDAYSLEPDKRATFLLSPRYREQREHMQVVADFNELEMPMPPPVEPITPEAEALPWPEIRAKTLKMLLGKYPVKDYPGFPHEDIADEAIMTALEDAESTLAAEDPSQWVKGIAKNKAREYFRSD